MSAEVMIPTIDKFSSIDKIVYDLDTPSVVPYSPPPVAPPAPTSYLAAFDPSNKGTFSPNSDGPSVTPNLTLVSPNYGYRAGVTSIEALIPTASSPAGMAPTTAAALPRPSNLIVWVAFGFAGYFLFKNLAHRRR